MGLISRFGRWLDRLLAPKATSVELDHLRSEFNQRIDNINISLPITIVSEKLSADILTLRDELNAIKALYKIGGTQKPTNQPNQQKFDGSQPWKR